MQYILSDVLSFTKFGIFEGNQFSQSSTAGLGKYCIGGYGQIGV